MSGIKLNGKKVQYVSNDRSISLSSDTKKKIYCIIASKERSNRTGKKGIELYNYLYAKK